MKMCRWIAAAVAVVALAAPLSADAVQITGGFSFSGLFTPETAGGVVTGMDSAQRINWTFSKSGGGANAGLVSDVVGDFSLFLAVDDEIALTDFTFAPLTPSPLVPLWSFNGISFDLTSVSVAYQGVYGLVLRGYGMTHASGFESTPGLWSFSGQQGASTGKFSYSAGVVPEPGTLLLLGSGLLGLGLMRRKISA